MQIALIQCPGATVRFPPLGLACLCSALKSQGHDTRCFDFNIEAYRNAPKEQSAFWSEDNSFWETILHYQEVHAFEDEIRKFIQLADGWTRRVLDCRPKVVGMSVSCASLWMSLERAKRIREAAPDVILVFGGSQIIAGPDLESLARESPIDYFVMGEGEQTLLDLVNKIDQNRPPGRMPGVLYRSRETIVDGGMAKPLMAIDSLPIPDFGDFDRKNYDPYNEAPILASRGCPNKCSFCNDHYTWQYPPPRF